ncbi:hypothetical protein Tco_1428883 [Tanacetum coccineum]
MKADPQLQQQDIAIWLALQMKFERNTVLQTACRTHVVRPRDQDDPHGDAHPEGENRNQEQDDDFDFWTDSYASDDDEIPTKQVSQDIIDEVSLTIDEAKLRKMADEMLRQRCTSGDEHQYHINQMKNFLKSDIVWESRKEILVSPHPRKTTPLVHSCQKDLEAPTLSLINQDLLYLKKGISGPEKIVLSLHKFPAIILNNDDIEEQTSKWVNSSVIWERVHDFQLGIESYQQKVNLIAPTMTFPGIEDHEMFSIIYEPMHGIIYKNSKKEKWVMRHSEIHKFCDATLNRVLKGLKSYNNDVKYGYVQKDITKDETKYLKLFEEEIEERLKHRRQMRRWEIDKHFKEQVMSKVPDSSESSSSEREIFRWKFRMKFGTTKLACRTPAVRPRDQDDPHDDAQPEGENSAKRQKTSEYEAYVSGESSSGQDLQEELAPLTLEVSLTIDEAKLRKMADEMLRHRCTSGDEHQYHIDQMKNFLKNDIVWENPEAPSLSLINQDLLYLKKGNSGPEKIVLSLHKFPVVIFNDDDIEERTSIWFITKIIARRANKYLVSIIEPDYKNLNKNDIEDIYLLIMNGKVPDYADTGLLWSLSVFIRSSMIWERVHDF